MEKKTVKQVKKKRKKKNTKKNKILKRIAKIKKDLINIKELIKLKYSLKIGKW